jgi:hypothetical protein
MFSWLLVLSKTLKKEFEKRLESLELTYGDFSSGRLVQLIQPDACVLKTLDLRRVKGFTNADLNTFLKHAAQTLENIKIYSCHISKDVGEELACDSNVDRMPRLKQVNIEGALITPRFLERKAPCKEHRRDSNCCNICVFAASSWGVRSRQLAGPTSPDQGSEYPSQEQGGWMTKALKTTGWGSIYIQAHGCDDSEDFKNARSVARERGVKLKIELEVNRYAWYFG